MAAATLRVLHIATLITPDGAYGGPIRVATNQVRALRELGHEALLVSGASGFAALPDQWGRAPTTTFGVRRAVPGTGFAGLSTPRMLQWLWKNHSHFDIAHIHLARDLVTLPAAALWLHSGKPLITQTHGMVMPTSHPLSKPLDMILTRRVITRAAMNLTLTDTEERGVRSLFENAQISRIINGVTVQPDVHRDSLNPERSIEILFLARLHPRKRPIVFIRAATELAPRYPHVRFTLIGPDEGEGDAVRGALLALPEEIRQRVTWEGSLAPDCTVQRMAKADIYALPSVDEPFPMSVLEAMSTGLPAVVTTTCGLASSLARARAGIVIGNRPAELVRALEHLIERPEERRDMGMRALRLARIHYSDRTVAERLVSEYTRALGTAAR